LSSCYNMSISLEAFGLTYVVVVNVLLVVLKNRQHRTDLSDAAHLRGNVRVDRRHLDAA
jgi:hypothetical protein